MMAALAGEATLLLSADVAAPGFAPGATTPAEAFLCTAVRALPSLATAPRRRSLGLLANVLSTGPTYGNRLTRSLQGVVDLLPEDERWLAFGALKNWGLLGQMGEILPGLRRAASDESRWLAYPQLARGAHRNWHDIGLDAVRAPDARVFFPGPTEALEAIRDVVDDDIKLWWIRQFPWQDVAGLTSTALPEIWAARTPAVELRLLHALPLWTGLRDKRPKLSSTPPNEIVDRQELVEFWTQWLGG